MTEPLHIDIQELAILLLADTHDFLRRRLCAFLHREIRSITTQISSKPLPKT
jgi:hypothetical protein